MRFKSCTKTPNVLICNYFFKFIQKTKHTDKQSISKFVGKHTFLLYFII